MTRALPLLLFTVGCMTTTVEQDTDPGADQDQETSQLTGTTIVSLTFDDTFAEQYPVGDMLTARGMRGTFYVNSPRFGRSGYMTLSQVTTLQQRGHEIAGHTLDHENLTTVTTTEAERQVCDDRNALLAAGFSVTSFAYPFGADSTTVQTIAKNCNYNSARDVGGLVAPGSCSGCPYANSIPPSNAYQVRTNGSIRDTTTLDEMKLFVTQAEQHGGGWVPFVFHHICNGCDTYSVSSTTLTAFLDWLAARKAQGTEVATVHAVIGGAVKPPAGSSPPPVQDETPPTARVTRPTNGATVNGITQFWAEATDNVGVARVRFLVDGVQIAESTASPYKVKWNATVRGQHQLSVQAIDTSGLSTTSSSITVTVR